MSAADQYSEEEKRETFKDLVTFVGKKKDGVQNSKKRADDLYERQKVIRQDSIKRIGEIAELIKELNDNITPGQTTLKAVSMGAKFGAFGGPVASMIGTGVSVVADVGYSLCSKHKIEELEKFCADAQSVLEEDADITEQLLHQMDRMRLNCEAIRECVKKLHSATLKGFFNNIPSLQPFVRSVSNVRDVEKPEDLKKVLTVVFDEAISLGTDPKFMSCFSAIRSYNPGVIELIVTIPEIMLSAGLFYTSYTGTEISVAGVGLGGIMKGLNALAIGADFVDIVQKITQYNEYPRLSKELLEIQRKLKNQEGQIKSAVDSMQKDTS